MRTLSWAPLLSVTVVGGELLTGWRHGLISLLGRPAVWLGGDGVGERGGFIGGGHSGLCASGPRREGRVVGAGRVPGLRRWPCCLGAGRPGPKPGMGMTGWLCAPRPLRVPVRAFSDDI
jgi:hypothetical protein